MRYSGAEVWLDLRCAQWSFQSEARQGPSGNNGGTTDLIKEHTSDVEIFSIKGFGNLKALVFLAKNKKSMFQLVTVLSLALYRTLYS